MDKHVVDLNKPFLTLSKEDAGQGTLGEFLANIIASSPGDKNSMKMLGWAQDLSNGNTISIDRQELDQLIQFVENDSQMTILAKGQIMYELHAAK